MKKFLLTFSILLSCLAFNTSADTVCPIKGGSNSDSNAYIETKKIHTDEWGNATIVISFTYPETREVNVLVDFYRNYNSLETSRTITVPAGETRHEADVTLNPSSRYSVDLNRATCR